MSKEDYREKIEEHRQLIETEDKNSRMSRSRRTVKKKKRKNPLMTLLLFVFIGIPFMILIYVSFIYTPSEEEVADVDKGGSVVELQKNNTVSSSGKETENPVIEDDSDDEKSTEQQSTDQQSTEEQVAKQAEADAAKLAEQAELEKQQQEAQQNTGQKVHTVQANENLFRIAMNYYNDPSGVEKIKRANGLSSDSISAGQTLIIP